MNSVFPLKNWTDRRNNVNDGHDFFGRKIEVGDTLLRIENLSGGKSYLSTLRVSSIGPKNNTVRVMWSQNYEQPIRYSGRTVILERGDGTRLEPVE